MPSYFSPLKFATSPGERKSQRVSYYFSFIGSLQSEYIRKLGKSSAKLRIAFITGEMIERAISIEAFIRTRACRDDSFLVVIEKFILPGKTAAQSIMHILRRSSARYVLYKLAESVALGLVARFSRLFKTRNVLPTIEGLARKHSMLVHKTLDTNSESTLTALRNFAPDIIVSMGMQRLRDPLLGVPEMGVLNVHLGLLPDYRGLGCYIRPIADGVYRTGATVHYVMNDEFDAGAVLGRAWYPVEMCDSAQMLHFKNSILGGRLLGKVLAELQDGNLEAATQGKGNYYSFPDKDTLQRVRANGGKLLRLKDILALPFRSHIFPENITYEISSKPAKRKSIYPCTFNRARTLKRIENQTA
jgi:methionyl-tRNA formyltransferase